MRNEQKIWNENGGWQMLSKAGEAGLPDAALVLIFGSGPALHDGGRIAEIRAAYPAARLVFGSTAGEINNASEPGMAFVDDNTLVVTALAFDDAGSRVQCAAATLSDALDAHVAGLKLARELEHAGLKWVMCFADGMKVNGSKLLAGLREALPQGMGISGGMAGDEFRMQHAYAGLDSAPQEGNIVVVGFYGDKLSISYGTYGGWDAFGPERIVTRAHDNVLYELSGEPALDVYKRYLGDSAKDLPLSALLFPMSIRGDDKSVFLRGVAAVNDEERSLTLFGDIPEGSHARLMRFNAERLIDGAGKSAEMSLQSMKNLDRGLAVSVSCMGRRLVLKQRAEEEVELLRQAFPPHVTMCGFYSYGEISPSPESGESSLHNYTMTITLLRED